MEIELENGSRTPIYKQIVTQVTKKIDDGDLNSGEQLPSARDLAKKLSVSVPTITRAYSQLDDMGYTFTQHGRGTFVQKHILNLDEQNMQASNNTIFISYAHCDDEASYGAISNFKEALVKEYRLQTGNTLNIFFDKKSIENGCNWREKISNSIGCTCIFMPFLSPSFLNSTSCMGELKSAYFAFEERGMSYGMYPLMFVKCNERIEQLGDDALVNALSNGQWKDISDLQYEEPSSSHYRKTIREVVGDIVSIEKQNNQYLFQSENNKNNTIINETHLEDEELLDAFEAINCDSESVVNNIEEFGQVINSLGNTTISYTNEVENALTFKQKLDLLRNYSKDIIPYANTSKDIALQINKDIQKMDRHVGVVLDCIPDLIENSEMKKEDIEVFCNSLMKLYRDAEGGFMSTEAFKHQIIPLGKMSRDLRSPVNTLQDALDLFLSTREIFLRWKEDSESILKELGK